MIELTAEELTERLLREAFVAQDDAWASRQDLFDAYLEWAEEENADQELPPARLYRLLRDAGIPESKRQGVRGFRVGIRSADRTPAGQVDRFLRSDRVTTGEGWCSWSSLHALYRAWARDANEEPMSLRRLVAEMDREGFQRTRMPDYSQKPATHMGRWGQVDVYPRAWGFAGVVKANPDGVHG